MYDEFDAYTLPISCIFRVF